MPETAPVKQHEQWLTHDVRQKASDVRTKIQDYLNFSVRWHLMIIDPVNGVDREEFTTLDELIVRMQDLIDNRPHCQVFSYLGVYMPITKPPRRLQTPAGYVRLYDTGETTEVDEGGFIGPEDYTAPESAAGDEPDASADEVAETDGDDA